MTQAERKVYHREWYAKNREHRKSQIYAHRVASIKKLQGRMVDYLTKHPCIDCGETDIVVLEFDHTSNDKTSDVGIMVRNAFSWENVLLEIAKCDVVCSNCHRRRTAKRGNFYKYAWVA